MTSAPRPRTASLAAAISRLTPTEYHVINEVYFSGRTLRALSIELGVTRSRVGQPQRAALNKLRLAIDSHSNAV